MAEDQEPIEGLVLARNGRELREIDWRDERGRRRCVDCGGWQLEEGQTALFVPILVAENKFGWICEVCMLTRLKRRAQIITATSSRCYNMDKVERLISGRLNQITLADD